MKKIIALVMGIAFAFGTAGFAAAQAPAATKTEEKKVDDTKKSDKMEKKGDKMEKKGDKKGKKGAKKDDSMEKKTEEKK